MANYISEYGAGHHKGMPWKWLLIYLIVAGVIYALVYYFVLAKNGSSGTIQTGQYQTQQPTTNGY